ncbi:hypothetical protein BJV82DRAFT_492092, partial [Fennellomyces sp. T-0311]
LPEVERRRFLAECPRNVARNYLPPARNNVPVNRLARRTDQQLYDIQFRLSGITRPLDNFLHQTLQGPGAISRQDAIDLVTVVHALLADTASHITQIRTDNMFDAAGIRGPPPRLLEPDNQPLLDPKSMVEHVKLSQAVAQTSQ